MAQPHANARLEAFCDGVFAIALTLLIIDIKTPSSDEVKTTAGLWLAMRHLAPSVFAFVLSFTVILITWANHHSAMRMVDKSSGAFLYANGLLLLTVVFVPFPTSLLGEYLATDHASPAVVIYSAVFVLQAIAWACLSAAGTPLTKNDQAARELREKARYSYVAAALYSACAVAALWFPHTVAVVISLTWVFWLVLSIRSPGD
jgi:uncharacterized membrane protein